MNKAVIGLAGAGTMGQGIAQTAAQFGHKVIVFDRRPEALRGLLPRLSEVLQRLVQKNKISAQTAQNMLAQIVPTTSFEEFGVVDFLIEAVSEDLETKRQLFSSMEQYVKPTCILATNTSSLSVTAIAAACRIPSRERVLGMHFFNPAPVIELVEVVPALQTDLKLLPAAFDLLYSWGKCPIQSQDTPGFIVNRLARPFYGEALRILEEGLADVPTIDWAMRHFGGFRMGPFEVMDLIGLDVNYTVSETIFASCYFDPRYRPSVRQKRMVEAGLLGRKVGQGFYRYTPEKVPQEAREDTALGQAIFSRILSMLINEAVEAQRIKLARGVDLDLAVTKGLNFPKGLLQWGSELGWAFVLAELKRLREEYSEERYRPSPLLQKFASYGTTNKSSEKIE